MRPEVKRASERGRLAMSKNCHHCRRTCSGRGAAATELVVLLPLLIALSLASVDFGRFCYAHIALGNAARVGAEYGATHRYDAANAANWTSRVESAMREEFSEQGGLDPTALDTEVQVADDNYTLYRVTITARYPFATAVPWPTTPRPLWLSRQIVIRRYR
jgi:Flp pilus assembly protein TadG